MTYTTVQPETQEIRNEVLDLWERNLPTASRERYDWLYENGPAQNWVVRDDGQAAIGSMGMMGRTMKIFEKICPAGQPIDLNVDKRHRLGGPAMQLQRRMIEAVDSGRLVLAYGLPNAQAEPVLRRVGYRVVGTMGRWTKPLRANEVLGGRVKNPALHALASTALNAGLWLTSAETRRRRRAGVHAEIVDQFDERFDRLWEIARDKFEIIGRRDAAYLQWRFAECPEVRYRTLCLCDNRDRLLAYLTYSQSHGRAYVGDLLFVENRDLELLLAEFLWMLRRYHKEAATMIFYGHPLIAKTLRKFGFYRRPSQWKVVAYANAAELAAAAGSADLEASLARALDEKNWFLTRADIDT